MSAATTTAESAFHGRVRQLAHRADRCRPGVLAWLAGLTVHCALVLLLVV